MLGSGSSGQLVVVALSHSWVKGQSDCCGFQNWKKLFSREQDKVSDGCAQSMQ